MFNIIGTIVLLPVYLFVISIFTVIDKKFEVLE